MIARIIIALPLRENLVHFADNDTLVITTKIDPSLKYIKNEYVYVRKNPADPYKSSLWYLLTL